MIVKKATTIDEALAFMQEYPHFTLFSGGSDVVVKLQKENIAGLIDISHINTLKEISKEKEHITIGALTTINAILESNEVLNSLALLHKASKNFASHQVRNIATLGGNVVNDSPVADLISPLLVLNATVTLCSLKGERTLPLEELLSGYKSLNMKEEIVTSFRIPLKKGTHYYKKVGAREGLNIAKLSLALFHCEENYYVSGASLNSYVQRLKTVEKLLQGGVFSKSELQEAIVKDTNPHSNAEYKRRVLFNMLEEALSDIG